MDRQEIADKLLRARSCPAPFGRNPERWGIAAGHVDTRLGSRHAILGVNQPEIKLRSRRKLQITERLIERFVCAINRNRHVNVSELVSSSLRQRIGEFDHSLRALWLHEMTPGEIAVTEMHADLHIGGNSGAQALHAPKDALARLVRMRHAISPLAIPDDH